MTLPTYATEDCIWLDVFGVVKDSVERDPEIIFEIERYLEMLKKRFLNDPGTN